MRDVAAPGDLVMHWVEVSDERGRSRMEARWAPVPESHAPVHAPVDDTVHAATHVAAA